MKKMLKRADGSKSQRGLWDNIRAKAAANKKAGKKGKTPSKDILEQEAKIKAEMKMGGDWMQDSKELKFGGPSKRKKYQTAPPPEENINIPTAVKYTNFTVSQPLKTDDTMGRKDNFITRAVDKISDRFSTTAGGGNKGGGSTAFNKSCIGKDCGKMMKSKAGKETNRQNPGGAKGLSSSPQLARGRVVEKSPEQLAIDKEKYQTAQDTMLSKQAEREARAAENLKAFKAATAPKEEVDYDFKSVYANPRDLTPIRMKKKGGKRNYFKK